MLGRPTPRQLNEAEVLGFAEGAPSPSGPYRRSLAAPATVAQGVLAGCEFGASGADSTADLNVRRVRVALT
jgi:hypothetical protein